MSKKIAALFFALLLFCAFYLYALLQDEDAAGHDERFVVSGESRTPDAIPALHSKDADELIRAFGAACPLPPEIITGRVENGSYHGGRTRLIVAEGGNVRVRGVRPLRAAPSLRESGLDWQPSSMTYSGHPLLYAKKGAYRFYYYSDGEAAYEIRLSASDDETAARLLSSLVQIGEAQNKTN